MSDARMLVGDVAVLYEELGAQPPPRREGNWAARFANWFAFAQRLLRLAIDAGIAMRQAPEPPADVLAAFRELVHEYGYFYGGQPWHELCVFRRETRVLTDLATVDDHLARFGIEMFVEQSVPAGMPRDHWWWFADAPP